MLARIRLVQTAALSAAVFAVLLSGCHKWGSRTVPCYRAWPAKLLSANSLEAEIHRQEHTGYSEGWPIPPRPVVKEPIPRAGAAKQTGYSIESVPTPDAETNPFE